MMSPAAYRSMEILLEREHSDLDLLSFPSRYLSVKEIGCELVSA
jgi:hypothetical protein